MSTPPASPAASERAWAEAVYERLAGDDDGRVCRAISAAACRETPGNFFRVLLANALSTLADALASAKSTLPWLLLQLGAPAGMTGLLVPIREAGSLLPQLLIGALVRRRATRKGVWVAGGVVQGLCLAAMGWVGWQLQGAAAGAVVVALLCVFALARGACSVAYKDVLGKTIPKTRRGRLAGWIGAVAGALSLAAGLALGAAGAIGADAPRAALPALVALLVGAALLWWLAAAVFARVVEFPGATEGGANGLAQAWGQLALLRGDAPFRRFVLARALAMGSSLAAPFYVVLAREAVGDAPAWLGAFIALEGLAALLSAPVWGRWADRSSRRVFGAASGAAALLSIAVALWSWLAPPAAPSAAFYLAAFLGLGIAHAGVRLGRKTYLLDLAEGNRRTGYVAVSNSVIGALLLASGALGALAATWSLPATVLLLGAAGLAGALLSLRWKEVSG